MRRAPNHLRLTLCFIIFFYCLRRKFQFKLISFFIVIVVEMCGRSFSDLKRRLNMNDIYFLLHDENLVF